MHRNKEAERSAVRDLLSNNLYLSKHRTWEFSLSFAVCNITWHKDRDTCHEHCSGTDKEACLYIHLNTKLFIDTLYKEGILKKVDVLKMELDNSCGGVKHGYL